MPEPDCSGFSLPIDDVSLLPRSSETTIDDIVPVAATHPVAERSLPLAEKPPLSPTVSHRPIRVGMASSAGGNLSPSTGTLPISIRNSYHYQQPTRLGAVASLAVDGGLNEADLHKLGTGPRYIESLPGKFSSSTDSVLEPTSYSGTTCCLRKVLNQRTQHQHHRAHHTAPAGTVFIPNRHIQRTKVTRCEICLVSPTIHVAGCTTSGNRHPSPLYLTRVGGIAPDPSERELLVSDRKASLPAILGSNRRLARVVRQRRSDGGDSFARINCLAQPYKSEAARDSFQCTSGHTTDVPFITSLTTTSQTPVNSNAPISPISTNSAPFMDVEKQYCSPSTHDSCHFFGSTYATLPQTRKSTKFTSDAGESVPVTIAQSTNLSTSSDSRFELARRQQSRIYQQNAARRVRNLRRYRHIYSDSLTFVPNASTSAPGTDRGGATPLHAPHRRCSADEALIVSNTDRRSVCFQTPADVPLPPACLHSSSAPKSLEFSGDSIASSINYLRPSSADSTLPADNAVCLDGDGADKVVNSEKPILSTGTSLCSLLSGKETHRSGAAGGIGVGGSSGVGSCGVAGPVGAFPLYIAAETMAASFGVQLNRHQQQPLVSIRSPHNLKKLSNIRINQSVPISSLPAGTCLSQENESSNPESVPISVPSSSATDNISTRGNILRSAFARMRQAASSVGIVGSHSLSTSPHASSHLGGTTVSPTSYTKEPSRQKSKTRTTEACGLIKSLPVSASNYSSLDDSHKSHEHVHMEESRAGEGAESTQFNERQVIGKTTIRLPLTDTLEPTNDVLQSFVNEENLEPVSANELPVKSVMQIALIESNTFSRGLKPLQEPYADSGIVHRTSLAQAGCTIPSASSISSSTSSSITTTAMATTSVCPKLSTAISSPLVASSSSTPTQHVKEAVVVSTKRFLRRPTEPGLNVELIPDESHETILQHQSLRSSQRSLMGSLALHRCPRSTVSAFVPFVIELCVTLVERFGLNCVGLYRVSGNKVAHDFMCSELCKQMSNIDTDSNKWNDIHAVCGVMKTFLRSLPDSLIPKVMYPEFLAASRLEAWERRLLSVQRLLSIMECYVGHPEYRAHRATLRYLATHLARVASRRHVNRMTPYNLALVFAPNLIQSCEDSPELFIQDSKFKIWLVETIIKYHKWIFSPDLGLESGCEVPEDSDEVITGREEVTTASLPNAASAGSPTPIGGAVDNPQSPSEFDDQPGRTEGDVRPILCEMLQAAAILPPPPSESDLEVAVDPGPSIDRPTNVATALNSAVREHLCSESNLLVSSPAVTSRHENSFLQSDAIPMTRTATPTISCDLVPPSSPITPTPPIRSRLHLNFGKGRFSRRLTSPETTSQDLQLQRLHSVLTYPVELDSSVLYHSKSWRGNKQQHQQQQSPLSALSTNWRLSTHRYSLKHLQRFSFRKKHAREKEEEG